MTVELDELMKGAWDLHCHCYPELSLEMHMRQEDPEMVAAMAAAGMAGVLLKSHFWPTMTRAYYLERQVPGIRIMSSIALNRLVGGLDPLAVEAAARLGAKAVFFPTWNSRSDMERGGFSRRVQQLMPLHGGDEDLGISVASDGRLSPAAEEILDVAKEFDLLVCTGHVSPQEALLVCSGARSRGLGAVFTHPLHSASMEEMRAAADLGAYCEVCCLQIMGGSRGPIPLPRIAEAIRTIGPQHCLLSTDSFGPTVPPAPELFRFGLGKLREAGFDDDALRQLVVESPRSVLRCA